MSEVHRVLKTYDNKYDALLSLSVEGRRVYIVISGLTRSPKTVKVSDIGGGMLRLELFDQFDQGFLTCLLERKHLEEEFASIRCCPGSVWIINEETLSRHRKCESPQAS